MAMKEQEKHGGWSKGVWQQMGVMALYGVNVYDRRG